MQLLEYPGVGRINEMLLREARNLLVLTTCDETEQRGQHLDSFSRFKSGSHLADTVAETTSKWFRLRCLVSSCFPILACIEPLRELRVALSSILW